ncbi:MAG: DNA/RNA nuclease SfsA [Proteobacteria bacterium]|nr:DNA/RNA nuclease SfsA [Pseudomonadota bacterium]
MKTVEINPIKDQKQNNAKYIHWPQLYKGTLVKRYKRFLADIVLNSGETITAHCANSGSMKDCSESGRPVFVSYHDDPKRKLKYSWQIIEMPTSLVGVNTSWPNKLVAQAIISGAVDELTGYHSLAQEVKVGDRSRLDIYLTDNKKKQCYIEVKNCTMARDGVAAFPDAVTTRGRKHLVELQNLVDSNTRCVMFYLIQRTDAELFRPADEIDPEYGEELRKAHENGIEILVYDVTIDETKIGVNRKIPFQL